MPDPFWLSLAVKMLASAAVLVAASSAVERSGPFVGAMIATLPISAGPSYVILALDHDPAFVSASALTSLVSAGAHSGFVLTYIVVAQRWSTLASVGSALAVWIVSVAALQSLSWTWPWALAFCFVAYAGTIALAQPYMAPERIRRAPAEWYDAFLRAGLIMAVVAAVVLTGRALGPQAAGLAASMPVVFASMPLVLQPRIGGAATAAVLANSVIGLFGFVAGLAMVHASAIALGSAAALAIALVICILWNVLLMARRWRQRRGLGQRLG